MYTAFWKLREQPFRNEFRPSFYFPSGSHQAALLKVRYAVEQRHASALLVGPAGTGKSFVMELLSAAIPESYQPIVRKTALFDDPEAFLVDLAEELGASPRASGYTAFRYLEDILTKNRSEDRHGILVIDNVHVFQHQRTWEVLRHLMTITVEGQPGWTVILLGHPLILPILEQLPHVEELLAIKSFLRPLTVEETRGYVEHCLRQAGATGSIFTPEALERLADLSGGIPRRINRLCDLALLVAYAEKSSRVHAHHVEAVFEELCGIPAQ